MALDLTLQETVNLQVLLLSQTRCCQIISSVTNSSDFIRKSLATCMSSVFWYKYVSKELGRGKGRHMLLDPGFSWAVKTSSTMSTWTFKFAKSRSSLQDLCSCIGILLGLFKYFLLYGLRHVYIHPDRCALSLGVSIGVYVKFL